MFKQFDGGIDQAMKLGDDKEVKVFHKGSIAMIVQDGGVKLIHDVYYVPSLAHSLLSIGQLASSGYSVLFGEEKCSVVNNVIGETLLKV